MLGCRFAWLPLAAVLMASAAPTGPRAIATAAYAEGPLWQGHELWFTAYGGHQVLAWDGQHQRVVWEQPGQGPAGLAPAPGGGAWVTCYDANRLVALDASGHVTRAVAADDRGQPLAGPNDLAADAHGGIYFTTSGRFELGAPAEGRIFYMAPGGRPHQVAAGLNYANGVALSADGRTLYVSETLAHRVTRFAVAPGGGLAVGRPFADLAPCVPAAERLDPLWGPDGLRVGPDGRVWAAVYGASRVQAFQPDGKPVGAVRLPVPFVTNLALALDGHTAYVTATRDTAHAPYPGAVYAVDLP